MLNKFLNFLKYHKQRILRKPRYLLTKRIRDFIDENDNLIADTDELQKIRKFLRHNLIEVFNDPFVFSYNFRKNKIYYDKDKGLSYVLMSGKRLYFKRNIPTKHINYLYNALAKEQDPRSPHYYYFEDLNISPETIVADIGVAEGNFSLKLVDQVKELYLFECEDAWIEALEATFEPWKEKVHIIKTFVSDKTDTNQISLDGYFQDKQPPDFLKIDVEGAEYKVLQGSRKLFERKKISDLLICTYHKKEDATDLSQFLEQYNYSISFSKGYMFFLPGSNGLPPFDFRKGLIHACLK